MVEGLETVEGILTSHKRDQVLTVDPAALGQQVAVVVELVQIHILVLHRQSRL